MSAYVLGFQDIDKTKLMVVGGKGANLGELTKIEGIRVPDGFCVSTKAFERIMGEAPSLDRLLDRLSLLKPGDREEIAELSGEIRSTIEGVTIPPDIREEIGAWLARLGEDSAYAVRSSATAEDLPGASFAGQQDTYLNVIGRDAILKHISRCWASLFTDRAVTYRLQHGFDHRQVQLSVVVQKMVFPQVSGILFTADPVTSSRKVTSIDASFGLGEALVSGLVNADVYKVRDGRVIDKKISAKKLAIHALRDGGTQTREIEPAQQNRQALTDEQIVRLERLGRTIERHFGRPQDIEWCLVDDTFCIVQSRPITTLFPIPEASDDEYCVYLSVGHQQMMTDAIKPLGLSFFLLTTNAPMRRAGGRLFVDVTRMLAAPDSRAALLATMGQHDPLMKDALMTIIEQRGLMEPRADGEKEQSPSESGQGITSADIRARAGNDPAIVAELIESCQTSIEELKRAIRTKSGLGLLDFILEDIQELKKILFDPRSSTLIRAAMDASAWINQQVKEWLGEPNVADTLSQSAPHNVTSEMGLALLDVADGIRPYPEVVDYLQKAIDEHFLDDLVDLDGGQEARDAIRAFLDRYGMRCAGEIDITRTRWCERPSALMPMILSNIRNFEPGASTRRFEQGRREALAKEEELLARLRQLPNGDRKAEETAEMIGILRNFIGYREYPKFGMISRYFVYKQALLREAERLVQAGVIREKEDIFYLTLQELREVVLTDKLDDRIISQRRAEYVSYERLTPPRVITSDGEIPRGEYRRENLPAGAIPGLPVSSGVAEGRARVILSVEDADLEDGDILVTRFTDPSWTPLFVSIKGLVTEVGGLMTHGAVIAREYGVPAVVGVEHATELIKDGQRIRVHGTEGYVEVV